MLLPILITYNLASHADVLRGSSRVPAPQIACVADVRGRGEGDLHESGEKGKGPLPSLPSPTPFFPSSLRPYPFQRLLTGYPTNVC